MRVEDRTGLGRGGPYRGRAEAERTSEVSNHVLYRFVDHGNAHLARLISRLLRRWRPATLLRPEHLPLWIARDLYVYEYDGEAHDEGDRIAVRRARILDRLPGWNERTARLAAADFAEAVLPVFGGDPEHPRRAIQAARDYAHELIGRNELAAISAAAWDVSWAAEVDRVGGWPAAAAAAAAAAALPGLLAADAAAVAAAAARDAVRPDARDAIQVAQGRIILDYAYGRL
ncbi:MAG: hypothetical protein KatS3mg015_3253 [Fimbriimonadales bacterium]|nr:MAG: hypothetical protein KatS3mg015_3253 [Fimbriimonadales bacterium]